MSPNDEDTSGVGSQEIIGGDGNIYDINNITGAKKAQLIAKGQVSADKFFTPSNMPGKKLAEMRAAHAARMKNVDVNTSTGISLPNLFQVGDIVTYEEVQSEILKVDAEKGVLINKPEGGKKWVHHSKVVKVDTEA